MACHIVLWSNPSSAYHGYVRFNADPNPLQGWRYVVATTPPGCCPEGRLIVRGGCAVARGRCCAALCSTGKRKAKLKVSDARNDYDSTDEHADSHEQRSAPEPRRGGEGNNVLAVSAHIRGNLDCQDAQSIL